MRGMRALPSFAIACLAAAAPASLAAQEPKPAPPKVDRAQQRLRADLKKLGDALQRGAHQYRGALRFRCNDAQFHQLDLRFAGAYDGDCRWFALDDWRVVTHGKKSASSLDQAAWKTEDDHVPELPLSPRLLQVHLPKAELSLPQPSEFEDRPALRVYAKWTGPAAAALVRETVVPSSQHERVMDALAGMAKRQRPNVVVDGTLRYDPATSRWLATTLRFAVTDGRVIEDEDLRPDAPEGLPQLTSQPMFEVVWTLQRAPQGALPRFALDEATARALDLEPAAPKRGK